MTEEEVPPWDTLGTSLGLLSNTLQKIESYSTSNEIRLRECLLHWLKWSDFVHDKGGATCDNLKEALTCIGKEEIAKRLDEKVSKTKGNIVSTKGAYFYLLIADTHYSVQDVKDEVCDINQLSYLYKIYQYSYIIFSVQ